MPVNNMTEKNIFRDTKIAEDYDNYYQSEAGKAIDQIEKNIFSTLLTGLPRINLLEAGCGTGHWTRFFSSAGFHVTAIDVSEAMLQIAISKNIENVIFQKADATRLPFADNSYSTIASVTMLEFIEDVNKVLDEFRRVLKPGGTLLLGCLNELSELGKNKKNDPIFKDAHFFTPSEIKKLLMQFGHPKISFGVYFSPTFDLLDKTKKQNTVQPAFIAASVKNTRTWK
jgi:ubiquinone/menaquinone biosynthesis C-methylase UbiE